MGTYMAMYIDINKNCFPKYNGNWSGKGGEWDGHGRWQDVLYRMVKPNVSPKDLIHYDSPAGEVSGGEDVIKADNRPKVFFCLSCHAGVSACRRRTGFALRIELLPFQS
ncbi:MAG: hypothetical protein L6W00_15455 [Lentisphaeria bacterium]|nr:MAG: hypothetical protein L6W00_15455 [Lentisphaeria bacterium]